MEDDPREPKKVWPRRLAIALGVLLALVVVAYFVGTSAFFLKSVILPKVGKSLNAEITVADASISAFSSVTLRDLRVKTTGAEPVLTAGLVRARYNLREIIGGHIKVDEVTVENPVITIVKNPDGTSNLDPIVNRPPAEQTEPSNKPMNLDIRNVALKNATVRLSEKTDKGAQSSTEISNLNVMLDQLVDNQPSKLTIASDLKMDQQPAPGTNNVLAAKINGSYEFTLNATNLVPKTIKGATRAEVSRAQGGFAEAAGVAAALEADVTPTQVNNLALKLEKAGKILAQIRASGPLDTTKLEGLLAVELTSLDRNALNLAGASAGLDFADSAINSTNTLNIRRNAQLITITGRLVGQKLGVIRDQKPTPPVDLDFNYRVAANLENKTAALEEIALSARHKNAQFLTASIDRPLNISWGTETYGLKDSNVRIALTNFSLADWQTIIGTNAPQGTIGAEARLKAQNDGKLLDLETDILADRLAVMVGTNLIRDVRVTLRAKGKIEDVSEVTLSDYDLGIEGAGKRAADIRGAIRYSLKNGDFNVQTLVDAALPALVAHFKLPAIEPTSGVMKYNGNIAKAGPEMKVSGTLRIDEFAGQAAGMTFDNHQVITDFNVDLRQAALTIHRASLQVNQGFNKGGVVEVNGRADIEKKSGDVTFKILELNEHALAPALAGSLGDKKLVSVLVNSSGTATFSTNNGNAVNATLSVTNLLVNDPSGAAPKTPLSLGLGLDVAQNGEVIDLRKVSLDLTPTERAQNRLTVQGKVDLAKTNAAAGNLTVASDALDLTSYYDIFGGTSATNQTAATPAPAEPAKDPNKEPEPMDLPLKQFVADVKIGALYLREVAISNWVTTARISSNKVTLKPLSLAINGAPVNGDVALDLGVAGYKYDIAFKADRVPVEPLANSFAATNTYKGFLLADAKIRGAGTTGANLKKNLQGQVSMTVTNFDYRIVGPKLGGIIGFIAKVLEVPELTQSPINWVDARANIGEGKVNLQKVGVESEAFYANVTGDILLNDVLTNSTLNLPITLSLRRSLAKKAWLLKDDAAGDTKYVALPQFATVKGTLGAPKTDIKEMALGGVLLRGGVGLLGTGVSENVKSAIDIVLPGAGASTNSASTNASGASRLLEGLGGLLNRNKGTNAPAAATNAPAGNTNAPKTNAPVQQLLNIFKK